MEVVRLEARSLLWKYRREMIRMVAVGVERRRYVWETSEKVNPANLRGLLCVFPYHPLLF